MMGHENTTEELRPLRTESWLGAKSAQALGVRAHMSVQSELTAAQPQGTTRWNPKGGATMPAPSHGTDVLLKLQGELLAHSSLCFYSFFPSSRQAQMTQPVFPSLHDFHYLWLITFHYLWLMSPKRYSFLLTRSRPVATPESSWGLGLQSTPSSLEAVNVL